MSSEYENRVGLYCLTIVSVLALSDLEKLLTVNSTRGASASVEEQQQCACMRARELEGEGWIVHSSLNETYIYIYKTLQEGHEIMTYEAGPCVQYKYFNTSDQGPHC